MTKRINSKDIFFYSLFCSYSLGVPIIAEGTVSLYVSHSIYIYIERLENCVGLTGLVLNWFRTYLTGQGNFVALGDQSSKNICLTCGVPQGSIVGPLLFSLYMYALVLSLGGTTSIIIAMQMTPSSIFL